VTDVNALRPEMSETESTAENSAKAPMFKVLLLNDDQTPMEFVVWVLETMFEKTRDEAVKIMLTAHHEGVGVCGVYGAEEAGSLVERVTAEARRFEHPLKCAMERD
jgi:ATP-dependent Clp protease adaptor protein ClpS